MRGVHDSDGYMGYRVTHQSTGHVSRPWSRDLLFGRGRLRWGLDGDLFQPPFFPTLRNPPSASGQAFGDETDLG